MGIEIWVLLVLAAVLSLYLLPTLVRRREMMGSSRSEDRYSAGLRILATKAPSSEEVCSAGHGHAQIFESRPEVKVMDRPDVRTVRALRVERELREVRANHLAARARRRHAAERRALVVLLLLAASVVMALVAALTPLPWWYALYAPALVVPAFAYGRWATTRDKSDDLREVRRVAELRRQLRAVCGVERSAGEPAPAHSPKVTSVTAAEAGAGGGAVPSGVAGPTGRSRGAVVASARSAVSARSAASPARAVDDVVVPQAAETLRVVAAEARPRPAGRATGRGVPTPPSVELNAATPPQGWRPVKVPAPTYTLAARAPRRVVEPVLVDLEEPGDVRVPQRPKALRSYNLEGIGMEEQVFQPIDLDAVLARRRAVGE